MTVLQGVLAERDSWSAVGHCPIEQTMAVVGTKSAMLVMREAYYGTTRFDDFASVWRFRCSQPRYTLKVASPAKRSTFRL